MKNKTLAGLVAGVTLFALVGPIQAACYFSEPGWHMVSKHCNIPHAENWQEYTGGIYLQPVPEGKLFLNK